MRVNAEKKLKTPGAGAARLPCGRSAPREEVDPDLDGLYGRLASRLETFVDSHSLKRSEARSKILETIVYESRHFKPQDLADRLRKRHPEVGVATLYRTLPILVESGILQEGPAGKDGASLYELSQDEHHDHIVCTDCGAIFEFADAVIEKRQDDIAHQNDFVPKDHRHVIYAKCALLPKRGSPRGAKQ